MTQSEQFLNPVTSPTQNQPAPIMGTSSPVMYPLGPQNKNSTDMYPPASVVTRKIADNQLGQINQTLTGIDASKQANPTIVAATTSPLSFSELLKSNPDAAFYRAKGRLPVGNESQQFLTDQTPKEKPDLATTIQDATKTLEASMDPNNYNLPAGAKLGANGTVIDANGAPIGNATDFLKPTTGSTGNELQTIEDQSVQAYNDFKTKTDAIINGTVPLTAEEQSQMDAMKAVYQKVLDQQVLANKNYEAGTNILGITSGRSRYAPELQIGLNKSAMDSGIAKISEITTEMNSALASLKQSFIDKNYEKIRTAYDDYNKFVEQRKTALKDQRAYIDKKAEETQAYAETQQKQASSDIMAQFQNQYMSPDFDSTQKQALLDEAMTSSLLTGEDKQALLKFKSESQTQYTKDVNDFLSTQNLVLNPFTGQIVPMQPKLGTMSNAGTGTVNGTDGAPDENTMDPMSRSLLAQTGLSFDAFQYLTIGNAALTRMPDASRKVVKQEARDYTTRLGIDESTFRFQYEALGNTVKSNVMRNNQAAVAESELLGTIQNLRSAATEVGVGNLSKLNVAKIWAGSQLNTPAAEKFKVHLVQLRNELAMYNAATAGQLDSNGNIRENSEADMKNIADTTIQNGFGTGSIDGFEKAIQASREKLGAVLKQSISGQNKMVWDLFGVGQNYNPNSALPVPDEISSDIQKAISDTKNFPNREALIEAIANHYGITPGEAGAYVYSQWTDDIKR